MSKASSGTAWRKTSKLKRRSSSGDEKPGVLLPAVSLHDLHVVALANAVKLLVGQAHDLPVGQACRIAELAAPAVKLDELVGRPLWHGNAPVVQCAERGREVSLGVTNADGAVECTPLASAFDSNALPALEIRRYHALRYRFVLARGQIRLLGFTRQG
eukprot:scaffold84519_cov75-Phaeocystis_antarctica.AAC.1